MRTMRMEPAHREKEKNTAPEAYDISMEYPSTRYFQIHFQHLYEVIDGLKEQLREANRQIAQQNEILRSAMQTPHERVKSEATPGQDLPGPARKPRPKPRLNAPPK